MKTPIIIGLALIIAALVIPTIIIAQQYGAPYPFGIPGMMQNFNQWMNQAPPQKFNPMYGQSYNNMWGMMQGMHGYGGMHGYNIPTMNKEQLAALESQVPSYITIIKENKTIIINSFNAEILVLAGPEGNMYSFEIYGLINPTIVMKQGTNVKMIVVNVDEDMPHSLAVVNIPPPYPQTLHMIQTYLAFPGATTPMPMMGLPPAQNNLYPTWTIEFTASSQGTYYYICAVPQHAALGMYGTIIVK
jgi:rusticyanin